MNDDSRVVRIAALGDIHVHEGDAAQARTLFTQVCHNADILILCGDLTNRGLAMEADVLADALFSTCRIPVVGVLGNHDYECGQVEDVKRILCQAGLILLDDEPRELEGVGFAGVKGFCGGFDRHALAPFGEPSIKDFVHETVEDALRLERGLARLRTAHKIVVLHYSPTRDTVEGEPPEIYAFLGSSRLAEPIDRYGATAVFHGHAHNGSHRGKLLSDVPVYNVSLAIMQRINPERPYCLMELPLPPEGDVIR